jgi:hypothetical protein
VASADAYEGMLRAANISLQHKERQGSIWAAVTAAAAQMGGVVPETASGDLLTEVSARGSCFCVRSLGCYCYCVCLFGCYFMGYFGRMCEYLGAVFVCDHLAVCKHVAVAV